MQHQPTRLPNTSIDTYIKVAAAGEFLLPFSPYYAYPFTAEYYIGTADLRGVPGGRKNGSWIRESTKKMPYNFTAAGALVFHAIVALVSRVYYGPSIGRAESNIGWYKRIKRRKFTSPDEGAAPRGERVSFTSNFITQFYRGSSASCCSFSDPFVTYWYIKSSLPRVMESILLVYVFLSVKYGRRILRHGR